MNDLSEYIGIPFKYNGRTREELDCYGLVMLLYKNIYGIDLPDVISPTFLKEIHDLVAAEKVKWTPCELEEGAVIVFNIKGYGSHVAFYLGDDHMIHTWEATGGVTIERIGINWKHRILGVYKWTQNSQ
jgi:cell wall-associated NlpC family hydrolase